LLYWRVFRVQFNGPFSPPLCLFLSFLPCECHAHMFNTPPSSLSRFTWSEERGRSVSCWQKTLSLPLHFSLSQIRVLSDMKKSSFRLPPPVPSSQKEEDRIPSFYRSAERCESGVDLTPSVSYVFFSVKAHPVRCPPSLLRFPIWR